MDMRKLFSGAEHFANKIATFAAEKTVFKYKYIINATK